MTRPEVPLDYERHVEYAIEELSVRVERRLRFREVHQLEPMLEDCDQGEP